MNAELVNAISHALQTMDAIPLEGNVPPFPWDAVSEKLKTALDLTALKLSIDDAKVVSDPFAGYGKDAHVLAFNLTPMIEKAYLIISVADRAQLLNLALSTKKPLKGFSSSKLQEGFFNFLFISACQVINSLGAFGDLSATLASPSALELEGFAIDLSLKIEDDTLHVRIFCPPDFETAFAEHFSGRPFSLIDSSLLHTLDVEVALELGSTTLKIEEWENLNVGDFVFLKQCGYNPEKQSGSLVIYLGKAPLFQAHYKEGVIQITDFAYFFEEGEPLLEDAAPEQSSETIALKAQLARLSMKLDKLIELEIGSTLEIQSRPELGVELCIDGKKVASAEILKLGDALGLKILNRL